LPISTANARDVIMIAVKMKNRRMTNPDSEVGGDVDFRIIRGP
jgi:hypothetical protein